MFSGIGSDLCLHLSIWEIQVFPEMRVDTILLFYIEVEDQEDLT